MPRKDRWEPGLLRHYRASQRQVGAEIASALVCLAKTGGSRDCFGTGVPRNDMKKKAARPEFCAAISLSSFYFVVKENLKLKMLPLLVIEVTQTENLPLSSKDLA